MTLLQVSSAVHRIENRWPRRVAHVLVSQGDFVTLSREWDEQRRYPSGRNVLRCIGYVIVLDRRVAPDLVVGMADDAAFVGAETVE